MPSPFSPDLSKLDWNKISGHITGIVAEVARTTPSPLDDIAVGYLSQTVTEWLKVRVQQAQEHEETPHMVFAAVSDESDEAFFAEALGRKGKILSPELLSLLVTVGKFVLPLLLAL
jgi:hypothetical protein